MQIKHIFNNTTKYLINFLGYPGHIQDNPEDVLCCLGYVSARLHVFAILAQTAHVDSENVLGISQKYIAYILGTFEIRTMAY